MNGNEHCRYCIRFTPVSGSDGICDQAPEMLIPNNGSCRDFEEGIKLMELSFTIPGEAVPQCRPRFTHNGGRPYQTKKVLDYKQLVKYLAEQALNGRPLTEKALRLEVEFYTTIPVSTTKKKRQLIDTGVIFPTKKPDVDNVVKSLMDGMNKVVYYDDTQVVDLVIHKRYSDKPRLEVKITEIGDRA